MKFSTLLIIGILIIQSKSFGKRLNFDESNRPTFAGDISDLFPVSIIHINDFHAR